MIVAVLIFVFELDHLEHRRMDGQLDPAPIGVASVDLVAAVVDLDAAHRSAVLFGYRHRRNDFPALP